MQARVALHEIADVFLFGDWLFRLPLAGAGRALFRIKIEIIPAVLLLADAADNIGVGAGQIGLHHVDAGGVIRLLKCLERGQRDEIFVPDFLLRGPSERFVDGAQAARDLVLKIDGVVDHMQIRVCAPCAQRQVVLFPRKFQRLIARLVAEIIGKLRALGAGNEVQDGIIVGERLLLSQTEARKHLPELLIGDIGLIVEKRAVIQHDDVLLRHHLRRLERQLLLVQLVGNDKILKIQHGHASAEGLDAEAGDQLRRGFGDGNDLPALVLLKFLENAADKRRLACGRPAGQHDPRDLFCQKDRSFSCKGTSDSMPFHRIFCPNPAV